MTTANKEYTVHLSALELTHVISVLGKENRNTNIQNLERMSEDSCYFEYPNIQKLAKETVDNPNDFSFYSVYRKFSTQLDEAEQDLTPKTEKVYFCLFLDDSQKLRSSPTYGSVGEMTFYVAPYHIVEIFERDIPA